MADRARGEAKGGRRGGGAGAPVRRRAGPRPPRDEADEGPLAVAVPGWLPPLVFGGLTLFLFRAFVFGDAMLFGGDTLSLGYVARAFYAEALHELGTIPRWAPHILGGTPFLEALSGGDSLYPPSLALLLVLEPYRALGWKLVLHVAAAGFFMYGWIRALGLSRSAALLAGTAYMLAPAFVGFVHPGHDGKIFVIALTPLLFQAVEWHFRRPSPRTVAAIALVVGLVLLTTHFQMAYFAFGAAGLYGAFRTILGMRAARKEAEAAAAAGTDGAGDAGNGVPARAIPSEGPATSGDAVDAEGVEPGTGAPAAVARSARRPAPLARFALFLVAALLGAGVGAVQLLPAVDYVVEYSRRTQTTAAPTETGVAWSSSWSIHPEETLALVLPEFAGNDAGAAAWARDTYWGRNPFKDNHEYAGLVALMLAAVALAAGPRRRLQWFLAGLGALALLFSLGAHTPVWRLFYELVPGISLFRAPSQAMFLFAFSTITLAAIGLDTLLDRARPGADGEAWRPVGRVLLWGTAALAALLLLAASGALSSLWTSVVYRDISVPQLQAMEAVEPYVVRGAFLGVLLAGGLWGLAWAARARRLAPGLVVAGIVTLAALDALRVDTAFVEVLDFEEWAAPDPLVTAVLEREEGRQEPFRLLSFRRSGQDVRPALQGIELAAGHHPNDLGRYRELIGMVGSSVPRNLVHPNVRRILNVRYILWPDLEMGGSVEGSVVAQRTLADGRPYETLLAEEGLPRARLVASAVVRSDEEAVPYILSDAFRPEAEVVLPEPPPIPLDGGPVAGEVEWVERTPNRLLLSVQSDRPALLVIADNWFPAWRATVEGREAPVLRANHTLRAVPVPAGASVVEMTYRSGLVRASAVVSLVVTAGLVLTALFAVARGRGGRARP